MKSSIFARIGERMKEESKHIVLLLLDIVIVVMCVVVIGSVWRTVSEFYTVFDRNYTANSFYYRTRDEEYALLADMAWSNRMYGRGEIADFQEYYAVADYYDAAVQYYVCLRAGDTAGAERWLEKMKEAENRMGGFTAEKEKIDRMLQEQ